MTTDVTLEGVKREAEMFRSLSPIFEVTFSFTDGLVAGTVMIPIPTDQVSETSLIIKAREHLQNVFLRLAAEVVRPQEVLERPEIIEDDIALTPGVDDDPSEIVVNHRREAIAAAKLMIAVQFYADGSVPGAETIPCARQDAEGFDDAKRFATEVHDIIHILMPDGFGGVNKSLNLHIERWLREGDGYGSPTGLASVRDALDAMGAENAKPQACQRLWQLLRQRAR